MNPFEKPKKRKLAALQLAPLIDIFVLIIVFLVKGTVLGGSNITMPPDLKPAQSKSAENMEIAPEVYLTKEKIYFKFIEDELSLAQFESANFEDPQLLTKIQSFLENLPEKQKNLSTLVNMVADKDSDYLYVFELTKFLRVAGFQNVLYVAEGDKSQ